jgi:hypothetical protein
MATAAVVNRATQVSSKGPEGNSGEAGRWESVMVMAAEAVPFEVPVVQGGACDCLVVVLLTLLVALFALLFFSSTLSYCFYMLAMTFGAKGGGARHE